MSLTFQKLMEKIPNSYLISKRKIDTSTFSDSITLCGGYEFHRSACLEYSIAKSSESNEFVLIAGIAFDVANQTQDLQEIAHILVQKRGSEWSFWDYLDRLSGRYIVVYGDSTGKLKVVGDATGMLKILYCLKTGSVSSNIFILKDIMRGDIGKALEFGPGPEYWRKGAIADRQPYPMIKILTANHELEISSLNIKRIFPRKHRKEHSLDDVTSKINTEFKGQLKLIRKKYAVFSSITAGIDSRVTLSILLSEKSHNDTFFTFYFNEKNDYIDTTFGIYAADKYRFKHVLLRGSNLDALSEIRETLDCECEHKDSKLQERFEGDWFAQSRRIVNSYKYKLIPSGHVQENALKPLHIRSNLYEIVTKRTGEISKREIFKSSEILPNLRRKEWKLNQEVCSEFADFFEKNDYKLCATMGYNLADIFYWEHTMATWMSEVLSGTDYAFNSHIFLNSRYSINLLLSIEHKQRIKYISLKKLVRENLPSLSNLPINSNESYLNS